MRPHIPSLILLLVVVSLPACQKRSPADPGDGGSTPTSTAMLIRALEERGATVEQAETMPASAYPFFSVRAQRLVVNGESVHVFEYPNPAAAAAERGEVSAEGTPIGRTQITWVAPPRFYGQDRLIVLYVGRRDDVARALESILGPPFAGVRM